MARHSAAHSGLPVDWQSDTLITVGATEALASAFMGLLNRGDEVNQPMLSSITRDAGSSKGMALLPNFRVGISHEGHCHIAKECMHVPQVVLFDPQYDAYIPLCIANGGVPKVVKLNPSDWSVPHDQLAAAFNERTKFILINSPHNPTGKVFSTEDLEFIAGLCKQWGTYAVLDEVSLACFLLCILCMNSN